MKRKGTTGDIFTVRQMQDNFRVKGKKLYFAFMDLEKAFDRVLRAVIRWALHKLGVEEWLVSAVISMNTGAKIVVGTVYGNSTPLPSNRHHRSNGDCLEGKRENYQVCSVQYCVQ